MSITAVEAVSESSKNELLADSMSPFGQVGCDAMDKIADKVISTYDKDGDGVISQAEMSQLPKETFQILDTDGNGTLDKDELKAYTSQMAGQVLSSKELGSALSSLPGGAGLGSLAGLAGKMLQQSQIAQKS